MPGNGSNAQPDTADTKIIIIIIIITYLPKTA